jgi:hypothetical protein
MWRLIAASRLDDQFHGRGTANEGKGVHDRCCLTGALADVRRLAR